MKPSRKSSSSENKNISISGDVKDSAVFIGDNNTVNQTIIQKFFNIFKSDSETLEHRNRRILLGHVENAWIKGVLDASLHGAALLDLGIKQDPEAVTQYPWAIKRESTDETLPAGTSMLEIFDSIGMGRSLLILGAPGSGKTTMLLELARGMITRAREDVTEPIPMVFNLASWTEKLTLADWLAQELNNLYSVPRKIAPDWVKGNKLLLLLDGLDEVRQDNRAKCVEAINAFRKEHGLTSLAVCSRSQDYADLNEKLSFEGAIEVQPLTQKQITEFFNRFGKEMAGIKQVLKKDSALREMAETPLFLSIMIMAYRDKQDVDILVSQDEKAQRKHLFDTYIDRMFERPHSKNISFKKQDVLRWLTWLTWQMNRHKRISFNDIGLQPFWLDREKYKHYVQIYGLIFGLIYGVISSLIFGLIFQPLYGLVLMAVFGLIYGLRVWTLLLTIDSDIQFRGITGFFAIIFMMTLTGGGAEFHNPFTGEMYMITGKFWNNVELIIGLIFELIIGTIIGLFTGLIIGLIDGLIIGLNTGLLAGLLFVLIDGFSIFPRLGLIGGLFFGQYHTKATTIKNYFLHFFIALNNLLPWRLVPFLDHCVDLIFLRRVGGGYIFVHRLLMEHFAEMYVKTPTSKGN